MTDAHTLQAGLQRARTYCQLRRFDEAARLAQRLLGTYPDHAEAWCLLAQARLGLDDGEGALDAARHAVGLAPDDEWPHRLTSIALSRLDRDSEAMAAALECLRIAPFVWQTHARVAESALALGLIERAASASTRACEIAPLEPRVWVVAGDIARKKKDSAAAEAFYRKALQLDPQEDAAHAGLARLHLERPLDPRGLAAAASGFATAVRVDPRARHNRDALEAVLRVFLARTSYFLFLVCYVAVRFDSTGSSSAGRILPLVLLSAPALFAVLFVVRLSPAVRRHFVRTISRGLVAAAAVADLAAAGLLVAGALVQPGDRATCALIAVGFAAVARLALIIEFRRRLPTIAPQTVRGRFLATVGIACAFILGGLLVAVDAQAGAVTSRAIVGVFLLALGITGGALLMRRRRAARGSAG